MYCILINSFFTSRHRTCSLSAASLVPSPVGEAALAGCSGAEDAFLLIILCFFRAGDATSPMSLVETVRQISSSTTNLPERRAHSGRDRGLSAEDHGCFCQSRGGLCPSRVNCTTIRCRSQTTGLHGFLN